MKKVLLGTVFGLAGLLVSVSAWADPTEVPVEQCGTKPSCADMGFTRSADDCIGYYSLRCPWDKNKYYCQCHYKYAAGGSQGDPNSPSCKRFGTIYYKYPCEGVRVYDCEYGVVGNMICTDTSGDNYYEGCSGEKPCEVGDLLYSSSSGIKKCFKGIAQSQDDGDDTYEAIAVVIDDYNSLAIALDENRGTVNNNNSGYGECDPDGVATLDNHPMGEYYKGVPFYRHCKKYWNNDSTAPLNENGRIRNFSSLGYDTGPYRYRTTNGAYLSQTGGAYEAAKLIWDNRNNMYWRYSTEMGSGYEGWQSTSAWATQPDGFASFFPAVTYCNAYSKIGAPGGSNSSIGSWVLPAPGDLSFLYDVNLSKVNNTLRAYKNAHNRTDVSIIGDDDRVTNNGKNYVSFKKYWTAYTGRVHTGALEDMWMLMNGFRQLRQPDGPVIVDFSNGDVGPVRSTEPGVRARCMIKYAE